MKRNLLLAAVALAAALGGYFLARVLDPGGGTGTPAAAPSAHPTATVRSADELLGQRRPDFTLEDGSGQPVSAADFDGSIWLVNFWASWCAPCVEEMPMLSDLQQKYEDSGVRIVGIALDDPDRARAFAEQLGVDYTILFGRADAVVTGRRYGNATGLLPFSVLVDAGGTIRWTHLGALERDLLESRIGSLR